MSEHLVPHVKGNVLGDPGIYVAFTNSYEIGKKRYRKGCNNICNEEPHILAY